MVVVVVIDFGGGDGGSFSAFLLYLLLKGGYRICYPIRYVEYVRCEQGYLLV